MKTTTEQMTDWIYRNLFVDSYFQPGQEDESRFGVRDVLYFTPFAAKNDPARSYFVENAVIAPRFSLDELVTALKRRLGSGAAFWFWVVDPDNALSLLRPVELADPSFSDYALRLKHFTDNPAEQGGESFLGLIPASKDWLLVHEFSPGNDFTLSFHARQGERLSL